ncbi:hypothetical protein SFRURICE_002078 [Spodoptera frugiperda]|nr:hypothetical protein SFRURICE_002078 [Spodoptera frugiperda]
MTSSELDSRNIAISMRKSVENLVISSQDAIGQSISQALTFSGVITQHANNIIPENRLLSWLMCLQEKNNINCILKKKDKGPAYTGGDTAKVFERG